MRNELEIIAQIERYLAGQLSDAEKKAFEAQLAEDPQLRENLRLQQDILAAIDRTTAQTAIRRARTHWLRTRYLIQWGGLGLGLVIAAVLLLLFMHHTNHGAAHNPPTSNVSSIPSGQLTYTGDSLPPVNESGEPRWAAADSNIAAQTFWVNASMDTVIETKGGILFSVSAGSFLDRSGAAIKGTIELIVKEALDPATIIKAGLATRSGHGEQSLLETGGMFFLDARKNGHAVSINPNRAIYAQIPTDSVRARMQLFTGRRMADGTIDWVKPRPLNHDLIPIDINLLNFYPPHYLDSVAKWGYNSADKKFTDSLYYSFARFFSGSDTLDTVKIGSVHQAAPVQDSSNIGITDTIATPKDTTRPRKQVYPPTPKSDSAPAYCGINPAKIKAIWNTTFQNTLISTRAFEKRLTLIHQSGDNSLLDLYVDHLDKDLCSIDSLAAAASTGKIGQQFLRFAARKDGKVKNGVIQLDLLRKYYQNKAKACMEAITKTQNDFWNEQNRLDELAATREFTHLGDSIKRILQNIDEEFRLNLKSAYAQLGYDTTLTSRPPATNRYTAQIISTGWCNVDRYAEVATVTRQSMAYTDPNTGKKAVLTYQSVSFQFQREQQYSRIYVYLLPDKLNSFMRLSDSAGKFTERINKLITYRLICIAYKEEKAFFYTQSNIRSQDYADIILTGISNTDLDQKLNELGSRTQANDLQQEMGYFQFEIRDQKRQRHNQELGQLTYKMVDAFFSCIVFTEQDFLEGQYGNAAQPVQVPPPTQ